MRRSVRSRILFAVFVVDVIAAALYYNAYSYLLSLTCARLEAATSNAVYAAIASGADEDAFSRIYDIRADADGKVTFVGTDSYLVNALCRKISLTTYELMTAYAERGIEVPWGALTGLRLFDGAGDTVRLKLLTVVNVKCDFSSDFSSAGVNQTRQRLSINVEPEIKIVIGMAVKTVKESVSVLVSDNIIVGDVPDFYVNARAGQKRSDLP